MRPFCSCRNNWNWLQHSQDFSNRLCVIYKLEVQVLMMISSRSKVQGLVEDIIMRYSTLSFFSVFCTLSLYFSVFCFASVCDNSIQIFYYGSRTIFLTSSMKLDIYGESLEVSIKYKRFYTAACSHKVFNFRPACNINLRYIWS